MDSLTQLTLGAAVGEALLGRKIGARAALWGGLFGTLPDLDVLAKPFISEIQELAVHRGFSHSLTLVVMGSPLFGWLLARLQPQTDVNGRQWSTLVFWALLTHILLDCLTSYGTQIFQPFSDYPVIIGSIFIIDPLYTVPLALGLLTALFLNRATPRRRVAVYTGLGISTAYLLFTLGNRWYVENVFEHALRAQGYPYQRLLLMPTAFNNLLWIGMTENADQLWIGHYSLLDADRFIPFRRVEKNSRHLEPLRDDPAVQRLLQFSRGYYTVVEEGGALRFNDLHLPRTDIWLQDKGEAIFSYRLFTDPQSPGRVAAVERVRPRYRVREGLWTVLFTRILGDASPLPLTGQTPPGAIGAGGACRLAC